MSGKFRQSRLATDIARVLGRDHERSASSLTSRYLLMTGVAVAIMQTQSAGAVSLGELKVQSGLGQPFVATTTARLGPGETLFSNCISAPTGGSELSSPAGLQVTAPNASTPGSYPVQVRSTQPLYEPMYEIRLQINCPGDIALSKDYVVMLNLPMTAPAETESLVEAQSAASATTSTSSNSTTTRSRTRKQTSGGAGTGKLAPNRGTIAAGETYRVRSGDTLSTISQRLDGRPAGAIWRVAEMLYSANPDAFVRGDRNMVKLGWVLEIPTVAAMAANEPSSDEQNSNSGLQANSSPVVEGDAQLNTTLGRPEKETIDNAELLTEIREASLAENANQTELQNAQSPVTDSSVTAMAEFGTAEISPFADESAKAVSETSATVDPAAESADPTTPTSDADTTATDTEMGMNPLLAVFAGVAMGLLLALLMLGRKIIAPLLEGRARRQLARATAPAPSAEREQAVFTVEVSSEPATPAYGRGGIDVEFSEAAPQQAPLESAPLKAAPVAPEEVPRVSLHEDEGIALEGTGTIRHLFEENASLQQAQENTDATAAGNTAELPALGNDELFEVESSDLDTLNQRLQDSGSDDKMSATLTEALGLLEKDYEDELSASQILKQQDVEQVLAEHKKA